MTFEYNGLVWFQTIGLKETAVSDQSRFQANGGAVYNTPDLSSMKILVGLDWKIAELDQDFG